MSANHGPSSSRRATVAPSTSNAMPHKFTPATTRGGYHHHNQAQQVQHVLPPRQPFLSSMDVAQHFSVIHKTFHILDDVNLAYPSGGQQAAASGLPSERRRQQIVPTTLSSSTASGRPLSSRPPPPDVLFTELAPPTVEQIRIARSRFAKEHKRLTDNHCDTQKMCNNASTMMIPRVPGDPDWRSTPRYVRTSSSNALSMVAQFESGLDETLRFLEQDEDGVGGTEEDVPVDAPEQDGGPLGWVGTSRPPSSTLDALLVALPPMPNWNVLLKDDLYVPEQQEAKDIAQRYQMLGKNSGGRRGLGGAASGPSSSWHAMDPTDQLSPEDDSLHFLSTTNASIGVIIALEQQQQQHSTGSGGGGGAVAAAAPSPATVSLSQTSLNTSGRESSSGVDDTMSEAGDALTPQATMTSTVSTAPGLDGSQLV